MARAYLLTRDAFREGVFARDKRTCVICGAPGKAAHHIIEQRLWTAEHQLGGYCLDNGATLCGECLPQAEQTTLDCDTIREAAGITCIALPEHLYDDYTYDKWGNIVLSDGRRLRGELFYDESVQRILEQGDVLRLFVPYVKYGRTHHLPWSHPRTDDKWIETLQHLEGQEVVASVKLDGEQTSMYRDHLHARSLEPVTGEDRAFVKALHARIAHDIPEGWRICGENYCVQHTIYYHVQNAQPPYFRCFSIWNERNECLSWDDTLEYAALLGLETVPVLYRGPWDEEILKSLWTPDYQGDPLEGYVVRVARQLTYREFKHVVAKYVRPDFVPGHARHWRSGPKVFNGRSQDADAFAAL